MINKINFQDDTIRLTNEEMMAIQGGGVIPWGKIIKAVLEWVGIEAASWSIEQIFDYFKERFEQTEEEDDQLYDGGEIDACVVTAEAEH